MGCIGQSIAFVQVDDSGAHTGWRGGHYWVFLQEEWCSSTRNLSSESWMC
eukprot:m.139792 g.139792  ORF g.139792 m.139792 type:complete len:50 (+) comp22763_c0_seq2:280-429(+)